MHASQLPLLLIAILIVGYIRSAEVSKSKYGSENGKKFQHNSPNIVGKPEELEQILPPEVVTQLKVINANASLNYPQKQEEIYKVMIALPKEVLDRIPYPKDFDRLSTVVAANLKAISRNASTTWAQKQQQLRGFISSMPADQKAIIIGSPPPKP